MTDTSQQLPPGAHPRDKSVPWTPLGPLDGNSPVPPDTPAPLAPTRQKPWNTDNEEAFPVYQRSAYTWQPGLAVISAGSSPVLIVGRQKGRLGLSLWVPTSVIINNVLTTTPNGVMIGSDPQEALSAVTVLNVGDSLRINAEGSCYIALIPGSTGAGYVQWVAEVNPPGGELGIY